MSDMDAYRDMFLAESGDYIQQITDGLLSLEKLPDDSEPVEVIFRGAHSLKGMAAAMGYDRTAELTHKMEGLMDRVRKGERAVDSSLIDLMLAAVDLVRDLIDDESNGRSDIDPAEMIAALLAMAQTPATAPAATGVAEQAVGIEPETLGEESAGGAWVSTLDAEELAPGERMYRVVVRLDSSCVLKAVRAYMVLKRMAHIGRVLETVPSTRDIEDERFDHEFTVVVASTAAAETLRDAALHVGEVSDASVEEARPEPEVESEQIESTDVPEAPKKRGRRDLPKLSETQTVRVAIGHLDTLVDLVGELIILRSRLERISERIADPQLMDTFEDVHRISSELQYEVMQTRMVPVGNIFNRFPRMVRDLAAELGKQVEFSIEGLDIELDRTVLDEIGDPIVHLLRNAIDHGVEPAEKRIAQGKPPTGRIRLSAGRERDHVSIVVSDDGRGIDVERVWNKACQMGLAQPDQRAELSNSDVLLFTCVPGFSTAEVTTKVSGRGVGMDVVKGKIEHLGGTLRIDSSPGHGTDFVLQLPLTLAIVKALLVESGSQTFALPLSAVNEVFSADEVTLDTIDGAPVVVLREGDIVPLFRLDALLFGRDNHIAPEERSRIVIVVAGGEQHAMLVDDLAGRQEIVIKPLSRLLKDSRGFSGATILGDGRVLLILDPRTIFASTEGPR